MSYQDFFGIKEQPFTNSPDSRYYFNSSQHAEALLRRIRESIIGRMRRHGGDAIIRSGPGNGTELVIVALELIVEHGTPEPLVCNGPAIDFEGGIPSDWTVLVSTGPVYWTTTANPAGCSSTNQPW